MRFESIDQCVELRWARAPFMREEGVSQRTENHALPWTKDETGHEPRRG